MQSHSTDKRVRVRAWISFLLWFLVLHFEFLQGLPQLLSLRQQCRLFQPLTDWWANGWPTEGRNVNLSLYKFDCVTRRHISIYRRTFVERLRLTPRKIDSLHSNQKKWTTTRKDNHFLQTTFHAFSAPQKTLQGLNIFIASFLIALLMKFYQRAAVIWKCIFLRFLSSYCLCASLGLNFIPSNWVNVEPEMLAQHTGASVLFTVGRSDIMEHTVQRGDT